MTDAKTLEARRKALAKLEKMAQRHTETETQSLILDCIYALKWSIKELEEKILKGDAA